MQKTLSQVNDYSQRTRTESEWYEEVQTYIWMTEDNIVVVPFNKEHLLEVILSPHNLNNAYSAVVKNRGCGGVDNMSCEQLLPWLCSNNHFYLKNRHFCPPKCPRDKKEQKNYDPRVPGAQTREKDLIKISISNTKMPFLIF